MLKKSKAITWVDERTTGENRGKARENTARMEMEIFSLPPGIVVERDVYITMRDGVKLAANVFKPARSGKFPVIVALVGPYGKDVGPDAYSYSRYEYHMEAGIHIGTICISEETAFEGPDPAYWVARDYVVVNLDARGFFKSEGAKQLYTETHTQDYHEVIEWAGTQEWSNGNVGLNGVSYLAIAQWYTASTRPPHLKAIIPWEGWTDIYRDRHFPGGVPETDFLFDWLRRTMPGELTDAQRAAMLDPVANQKEIEIAPQLEKIVVPALICASWSDHGLHTRGTLEGFKRIASQHKWLYTHGRAKWEQYYSDEALKYQEKFFDYYLKGIDNGMLDTPRVRLEVRENRESYTVRYENEWPIERTDYRKLYLDVERGTLNFDEVGREGKVSYDSREGRAEFDLTFDGDTELTGYMKLKLWVSPEDADDMDLIVAIRKFDTAGDEVYFYGTGMSAYVKGLVARGWLRVSQRELDEKRSTPWQPFLTHRGERKLSPGEIVPVEIEILPSSTLFRKGERLRLVVQGKDLIQAPPWGRYGYRHLTNKGAHAIYAGGKYDSHLLVPVIPVSS
jgi:predicted acyl esterase